jgi:hypothetical protein
LGSTEQGKYVVGEWSVEVFGHGKSTHEHAETSTSRFGSNRRKADQSSDRAACACNEHFLTGLN